MNSYSDIAGLFSKLPYDVKQYQEIGKFQELSPSAQRWSLVDEIYRSTIQTAGNAINRK